MHWLEDRVWVFNILASKLLGSLLDLVNQLLTTELCCFLPFFFEMRVYWAFAALLNHASTDDEEKYVHHNQSRT